MTKEIENEVRGLLQETYNEYGWYQAVDALNRDEAVPVVIKALENDKESDEVHRLAVLILRRLHDERAIPSLVRTLHASDRILRGRAADVLGEFEQLDQSVVQQLIDGLGDEDNFFRERCAKALAKLKRPEALPALEQMRAADSVAANRQVAEEAIKEIKGES